VAGRKFSDIGYGIAILNSAFFLTGGVLFRTHAVDCRANHLEVELELKRGLCSIGK
jgi:hypothetical protein